MTILKNQVLSSALLCVSLLGFATAAAHAGAEAFSIEDCSRALIPSSRNRGLDAELISAYRRLIAAAASSQLTTAELSEMLRAGNPFLIPTKGPSHRIHVATALNGLRTAIERHPDYPRMRGLLLQALQAELMARLSADTLAGPAQEARSSQEFEFHRLVPMEHQKSLREAVAVGDRLWVSSETGALTWELTAVLRVVDPRSGMVVDTLEVPEQTRELHHFQALPRADLVAATDGKTLFFWRASDGQALSPIPAGKPIDAFLVSPSGRYLAAVFSGSRVGVWDRQTNTFLGQHDGAGTDLKLAFSKNERELITVDAMGKGLHHLLGTAGAQPIKPTGLGFVLSQALSPDGRLRARYLDSDGQVEVSSTSPNEPGFSISLPLLANGQRYQPERMLFSPSGRYLVILGSKFLQYGLTPVKSLLVDTQTGASTVFVIPGDRTESVSFTEAEDFFYTAGRDKTIRRWSPSLLIEEGAP